jgi:hypothetical protein
MLSACSVDMDGKLGRKCVALDPIHCKRNGLPTPAETERARWCELVNETLAAAGHDVRIDHRTLKEQGIERDAQRHAGKGAIGVWAEITAHNAQVKEDVEELAKLDAEYAATTKKLQAIMREIEVINEPRMPFFPTTDAEAGQVRDRFNGLVDERMANHKADVARVTEIESRLSEIDDIHESQPQFWQYKKRKEKAAVGLEWRTLNAEWHEIKQRNGWGKISYAEDIPEYSRKNAVREVFHEFPAYAPALNELNRRVQIIQLESETKRQVEREQWERDRAAYFAELAMQQAKAPEPAPKAPEREIEPPKAQETPSKRRDDDSPRFDM